MHKRNSTLPLGADIARWLPAQTLAFLTVWEVTAPVQRVWDVINSVEGYPQWFPDVVATEQISPGDLRGVGAIARSRWTTALPYGFIMVTRTTQVEPPYLMELSVTGDLEGTGRWELSGNEAVTTVRYYWTVTPANPWLRLFGPVAQPAFRWNHAIVMQKGAEGLANHLDARLINSMSYSATSSNPLAPLVASAGFVSLGVLLGRIFRRVLKGRRPDTAGAVQPYR